jgi:hypothetical protein
MYEVRLPGAEKSSPPSQREVVPLGLIDMHLLSCLSVHAVEL